MLPLNSVRKVKMPPSMRSPALKSSGGCARPCNTHTAFPVRVIIAKRTSFSSDILLLCKTGCFRLRPRYIFIKTQLRQRPLKTDNNVIGHVHNALEPIIPPGSQVCETTAACSLWDEKGVCLCRISNQSSGIEGHWRSVSFLFFPEQGNPYLKIRI